MFSHKFFIFSGKCEVVAKGQAQSNLGNLHSKNSVCKKIGFCLNFFSLMLTRILASEKLPFQAISRIRSTSKILIDVQTYRHSETRTLEIFLGDSRRAKHLNDFGD